MSGLKIPNNAQLRTAVAIYKFDDIEFVNKDYFVVQLLKALQDLPKDGFYFVFAGGTCLSKAFNLIKRMSEDVDLRVIFTTPPVSRNALKKKLSEVKHLLEDSLPETFPGSKLLLWHIQNLVLLSTPRRIWIIKLKSPRTKI
jgi:hypothetical protein